MDQKMISKARNYAQTIISCTIRLDRQAKARYAQRSSFRPYARPLWWYLLSVQCADLPVGPGHCLLNWPRRGFGFPKWGFFQIIPFIIIIIVIIIIVIIIIIITVKNKPLPSLKAIGNLLQLANVRLGISHLELGNNDFNPNT